MKRVLTIDLDYDLSDLAKDQPPGSPKIPTYPEITRNIIEHTYMANYPKMKAKQARQWRRIVKACDAAIEAKEPQIMLADDDFKALLGEVEKCEYTQSQAFIVPVLFDELERIRDLPQEESKAKVLEMKKA
jgi:hypothetical protein